MVTKIHLFSSLSHQQSKTFRYSNNNKKSQSDLSINRLMVSALKDMTLVSSLKTTMSCPHITMENIFFFFFKW